MEPACGHRPDTGQRPLLIEGYASLFGIEDASGDIVRAGAFTRALKAGSVPMLLQHRHGAIVGRWVHMREDMRGLFVRGLVEATNTQTLVTNGALNGLSIGFRPRMAMTRKEGGRVLADIDLAEISLVAEPMLATARFQPV